MPLAINKYGPNNFVFLILQYCDREVDICVGIDWLQQLYWYV